MRNTINRARLQAILNEHRRTTAGVLPNKKARLRMHQRAFANYGESHSGGDGGIVNLLENKEMR